MTTILSPGVSPVGPAPHLFPEGQARSPQVVVLPGGGRALQWELGPGGAPVLMRALLDDAGLPVEPAFEVPATDPLRALFAHGTLLTSGDVVIAWLEL